MFCILFGFVVTVFFLVACSFLFEASQIFAELTARSKDRDTIGKGIKITFSFGVFCFGLLFFRFFRQLCLFYLFCFSVFVFAFVLFLFLFLVLLLIFAFMFVFVLVSVLVLVLVLGLVSGFGFWFWFWFWFWVLVCFGLFWFVLVGLGLVWFDLVWFSVVWFGVICLFLSKDIEEFALCGSCCISPLPEL